MSKIRCPKCGREIARPATSCPACGNAVRNSPSPTSPGSHGSTPDNQSSEKDAKSAWPRVPLGQLASSILLRLPIPVKRALLIMSLICYGASICMYWDAHMSVEYVQTRPGFNLPAVAEETATRMTELENRRGTWLMSILVFFGLAFWLLSKPPQERDSSDPGDPKRPLTKLYTAGQFQLLISLVMLVFVLPNHQGNERNSRPRISPPTHTRPTPASPPPQSRTSAQSPNAQVKPTALDLGKEAVAEGNLNLAIQQFSQAIAVEPNSAEAYWWRGQCHVLTGEYTTAVDDCTKAVQLDPSSSDAFCWRGMAHLFQWKVGGQPGEIDVALADLNRAIELDPSNSEAVLIRGSCWTSRGELERALADFSRAIELEPNDSYGYTCRGECYAVMMEVDKALADFDEALRLSPDDIEALLARGSCRLMSRWLSEGSSHYHGALEDANAVIRLAPDLPEGYYLRGMYHVSDGTLDDARLDFDEALRLDPQFAAAHMGRGLAQMWARRLTDAKAEFDEAIRLDPSLIDVYYLRGLVQRRLGATAEAEADFKMVEDSALHREVLFRQWGLDPRQWQEQ